MKHNVGLTLSVKLSNFDSPLSRILENGADFKQAYTKWSTTVTRIAEKNSKKRKKRQTWKVNRVLRNAKKMLIMKQKQKNVSKEERRLIKVQKVLIDEHIWNEMMTSKRTQIEKTVEEIKKNGGINSNGLLDVRSKIIRKKRET